jgi:hypothetical protein
MGVLHSLPAHLLITSPHTLHSTASMAAASTNLSPSWATRPITFTRSRSRVLVAVLFNKTSLAGGLSLRGHF